MGVVPRYDFKIKTGLFQRAARVIETNAVNLSPFMSIIHFGCSRTYCNHKSLYIKIELRLSLKLLSECFLNLYFYIIFSWR